MRGFVSLLTVGGIVTMMVLGYRHYALLPAFVIGELFFGIAYGLQRVPQLTSAVQRDGAKSILLFIYLILFTSIIAGFFYFLGWLLNRIFT